MKRFVPIAIITLLCVCIGYGLFLNTNSVRHGDVHFFNDVARDFLLLRELDEKKIVFIGPRTNNNGLFHGPLWTYVNYPAFLLSQGDPIGVEWFWVFLFTVFIISSFFIAQSMLSTIPALVYALLLTFRLATTTNGLFHSLTTFFVIPVFLYTIYQYGKTGKLRHLVFHLISTGVIIQLNIGVGGSLVILTSVMVLGIIIKKRLWKHIFAFAVIPLMLSNFILFDIKHEFRMVKTALAISSVSKPFIEYHSWIQDRINHTISMELLTNGNINPFSILQIAFFITIISTFFVFATQKKKQWFYGVLFFYYFGYMALSFENKGIILGHFVIPLIPITTVWLASFLDTKLKWIFIPLIACITYFNIQEVKQYNVYFDYQITNKSEFSWISLSKASQTVVDDAKGTEFGYYVFMPDSYAYQPRYAALYTFQHTQSSAYEYVKKPLTYVIAAPPPPGDPYMNETWWIANQVRITKEPVSVQPLQSGYKIYRYELTDEEQKIAHDKNIELLLSFR
jgi:hypothetical protein